MMTESHPMDLSGERLIESLKISPSKIVVQSPTANTLRNNAVKEMDRTVGEGKSLA